MKLYQLVVFCLVTIVGAADLQYHLYKDKGFRIFAAGKSEDRLSCDKYNERLQTFWKDAQIIAEKGKAWLEILNTHHVPKSQAHIVSAAEKLLNIKFVKKDDGFTVSDKASITGLRGILDAFQLALNPTKLQNPITVVCGDPKLYWGAKLRKGSEIVPGGPKKGDNLIKYQFPGKGKQDKENLKRFSIAYFDMTHGLVMPVDWAPKEDEDPTTSIFKESGSEIWSTPSGALFPVILMSSRFWTVWEPVTLREAWENIGSAEPGASIDSFRAGGGYLLRHLLIATSGSPLVKMVPNLETGAKVPHYLGWEGAIGLVKILKNWAFQSAENLREFAVVAAFYDAGEFSDGELTKKSSLPAYLNPPDYSENCA